MGSSLIAFVAGLVVILGVLAWMELRGRDRHRERVLEDVREAKSRGTHVPLAQHPQIDPLQCVGCGLCVKACPEDQVLEVVDGTAVVVHGSRCIGHGRCEEACPVGALVVGLGDLRDRDDVPILGEAHESSVPGLFLVGELSGIALIRNAVRHGVEAIDRIAARKPWKASAESVYDVAIVGAGPAGIAAALRCIEKGLRHVVLEQDEVGGTIRHYPRQKLVMTQPVELPLYGKLRRSEYSKEQLVEMFEEILERFPVRVRSGFRVESVRAEGGEFEVRGNAGTVRAHQVVLALGRRGTPRRLGVPGEDHAKVSYRLVDAARYQGVRALVVGGGDSAVEAALALAGQRGNQVTLSYRREHFFRLKRRNEEHLESALAEGRLRFLPSSEVKEVGDEVVLLDVPSGAERTTLALENDFVFVLAGGIPPFGLLREAGVRFGGAEVQKSADRPRTRGLHSAR